MIALTDAELVLIDAALAAQANAYCPYSRFRVGAALRAADGRIFSGCNVENASYGLTICAERSAIFSGVAQGVRSFDAIAVVTDGDALGSPCGACRQVIQEFAPDARIILANSRVRYRVFSMRDLLPFPFDQLDEIRPK